MSSLVLPHSRPAVLMDEVMRRRALRRLGMTALIYALATGFTAWTWAEGLLPAWAACLQVGVWASGLCIFYAMLRAGRVWNPNDPMLVYAQVLFGIGSIALCYAVNPHWRASTLQMLFVLLVFDMQRLRRRQIVVAGWLAIGALLVGVGAAYLLGYQRDGLVESLFFVGMAAVHVPLLSLLAGEVRGIRLRQEESRQELDGALSHLSELSVRDTLTGAFNRRHGLACAELEVKRQARGAVPCAMALVDLDHFKQINDHAGHHAGDEVLKTFASLARSACTPDDVFVRWGGEEFLLLLGHSSEAQARQRLDALREAVAGHDWRGIVPGGALTFSAGVAVPLAGEDATSTIARADAALYEAKHGGRNRVCVAERGSDG
jgi:diguanylate cyclase (GGDEF)-like protein